jgi:hypothetical protein
MYFNGALDVNAEPIVLGRVEEGRGGLRLGQSLRFPSPLIKPDVPISGIRLSDWNYELQLHNYAITQLRNYATTAITVIHA